MVHQGRETRDAGFVLLAVLVLLVLASVVMVGMARRSVRQAGEAALARADLQRRWGAASCRAAVLGQAERILHAAEERRDGPVASLSATIPLGDMSFDLVLSDEQAKANVNRLFVDRGRGRTAAVVRRLTRSASGALSVALQPYRPVRDEDRETETSSSDPTSAAEPADSEDSEKEGAGSAPDAPLRLPRFGSYAQVFARAAPRSLLRTQPDGSHPLDYVTLWGDGRLNVVRAAPDVMRAVCQPALDASQVNAILAARRSQPDSPPAQWVAAAGLEDEQREKARRLLTARSLCHALALVARDDRRISYEWAARRLFLKKGRAGGSESEAGGWLSKGQGDSEEGEVQAPEPQRTRSYRLRWP